MEERGEKGVSQEKHASKVGRTQTIHNLEAARMSEQGSGESQAHDDHMAVGKEKKRGFLKKVT